MFQFVDAFRAHSPIFENVWWSWRRIYSIYNILLLCISHIVFFFFLLFVRFYVTKIHDGHKMHLFFIQFDGWTSKKLDWFLLLCYAATKKFLIWIKKTFIKQSVEKWYNQWQWASKWAMKFNLKLKLNKKKKKRLKTHRNSVRHTGVLWQRNVMDEIHSWNFERKKHFKNRNWSKRNS